MNVYRVQYFKITSKRIEVMRGQQFPQRQGVEKVAFVVADSPEAAGAYIASHNDCDILGVQKHLADVEVATKG